MSLNIQIFNISCFTENRIVIWKGFVYICNTESNSQ